MSILRHKLSMVMLMEAAGLTVKENETEELYKFTDEQWQAAFAPYKNIPPVPKKIVAVGHRGTKMFAPENTIIAHEMAYNMGARAIEFDVRCTKDGHFVIIHDKKVDRTTNGTGKVKNLTLAEIKTLDAGSHKGPEFAGTTIPTLREALQNVRGRFAVDIDFKGGPKNSARILEKVLTEEGFLDDNAPLVTIFARRQHFDLLKPLSHNFALRPHYLSPSKTAQIARKTNVKVMGLRRLSFTPKAAATIRDKQFHLFSNVMGPYDHEIGFNAAIRAGSLFIQSDHLDKLVPYLRARGLLETHVLGRNFQPLKPAIGHSKNSVSKALH